MFGSADGPYLRLPAEGLPADITNAWVVALDSDLKKIRQISKEYQEQLVRERTQATPEATQNQYQPGDLVFFRRVFFFIKKNIIKILQGQTMKENNHPTEQDMQHPLSAAVEQITRAIK
jgi:hypothetical protein